MSEVFALVDCNNFYTSCEKIFYPALEGKPVAVLSNNDGCVIARSEEAKAAGIKMGVPVFEISEIIEKNNVHVFSTNYALYGDISQRVMNTLVQLTPEIEIYSIDEAFIDLSGIPKNELNKQGLKIKQTVKKWTGIPVSVGIAPTKTLAKIANHIAKKNKEYNGIFDFVNHTDKDSLLKTFPVNDIWGVGEKYAGFFNRNKICTAYDLKTADENRIKEHLGVMGQRLVLELRGTVCYPINVNPDNKKEICTTRSFGHSVESYAELEQATTSYVTKVAEKLRKQNSYAQALLIFIMTNKYAKGPRYVNYKIVKLPTPTNQTSELIHYAVIALKNLYKKGYKYKKSGVIVSDVIPAEGTQSILWDDKNRNKNKKILQVIDKINQQAGIEKVKFAIQGTDKTWKMKQDNLSPRYTTKWSNILIVDMDKEKGINNY
ncbi:MAG: Y-family DNA polymerase [Bacteroidales bacterium]|nr:Y-family DNA polymerase [Bacteroidales bacterium]